MSSHFCKTYPFGSQPNLKYVVILSEYEGKLLLSRHKDRQTFETQGGHIEPNETAWHKQPGENCTKNPAPSAIPSIRSAITALGTRTATPTARYLPRTSSCWLPSPNLRWQR